MALRKIDPRWPLAAILLLALLAGCGGGSSSTTTTGGGDTTPTTPSSSTQVLAGNLTDAPVAGVAYSAQPSGHSGTTDANGMFSYVPGDTVTFKAGGVTLGALASITAPTNGGNAVVTPADLTGEPTNADGTISSSSAPKAAALAQLLQTLNLVAGLLTAGSSATSGTLTVPSGLDLTTLGANVQAVLGGLQAYLNNLQSSGVTSGTVQVVSASDATEALNQGVVSSGYANTAWRATCDGGCGGGSVFLQANGTAVGITDDGEEISGGWYVDFNNGKVLTFNLVSSGGGSATGHLASAGDTSCTACLSLSSGGGSSSTLSLQMKTGTASSPYLGVWFAKFTPNAAGIAAGLDSSGGGAAVMAFPDGTVYGVTDGGEPFSGTWTLANGQGSAAISTPNVKGTVTFDLDATTGTLAVGGVDYGSLQFSRSNGTAASPYFVLHPNQGSSGGGGGGGGGTCCSPLVVHLTATYTNPFSQVDTRTLSLGLSATDVSGNIVASGIKPEAILAYPGQTATLTDDIAVSYPSQATNWALTFGNGATSLDNCTISGGTGSITGTSTTGSASIACH
ncbi:MAG: hypothetical protein KGL68_16075 [Burkholderiales bacterium]|nr:hypothetical protein [Burkholderiales bacterium]